MRRFQHRCVRRWKRWWLGPRPSPVRCFAWHRICALLPMRRHGLAFAIAPVVEFVIPVATVVGEKHFGRCCEIGCDCHRSRKLLYDSDMLMIWCCLMFEYNWSILKCISSHEDFGWRRIDCSGKLSLLAQFAWERSNWISNGTKNWLKLAWLVQRLQLRQRLLRVT